MYTIKTMNAISPVGLAKLPANQFEINNEANDAQGHSGAQRRPA